MPEDLSSQTIIGLYTGAILLGGIVCLVFDFRISAKQQAFGLEPWRARMLDFVAFTFGLFIIQSIGVNIGARLYLWLSGGQELWPYGTVMSFLIAQGCTLAFFMVGLRYFRQQDGFLLNPSGLKPISALKQGAFYFLAAMPLVVLSGLYWRGLIQGLRALGFTVDAPYQQMVEGLTKLEGPVQWGVVIFMAAIAAPLVEELIFRAIIYRFLKQRMPAILALTLTSLFFAVMHFNVLQFVPLFLLGMLLGRAYERSGSILVPITCHCCFNLSTLLTVALAPDIIQQSPV